MNNRDSNIDYLRGAGIILMVATHVSAYFLSSKIGLFIWNIGEVSVFAFIFCSVYLSSKKDSSIMNFKLFWKRAKRLLVPYYIFLIFEFIRRFFMEPKTLDFDFIFKNIFLTGGLDLNWLVLLFMLMAIFVPVLLRIWQKYPKLFFSLWVGSFLASVGFLFFPFREFSRVLMIISWSFVFFTTIYFQKRAKNIENKIILLSMTLFVPLYFIFGKIGINTHQYNHKYPPDIYHLAYGIFGLFLLRKILRFDLTRKYFGRILQFCSLYSYEIYFIHNLLLSLFWGIYWKLK